MEDLSSEIGNSSMQKYVELLVKLLEKVMDESFKRNSPEYKLKETGFNLMQE